MRMRDVELFDEEASGHQRGPERVGEWGHRASRLDESRPESEQKGTTAGSTEEIHAIITHTGVRERETDARAYSPPRDAAFEGAKARVRTRSEAIL